VVGYERTRDRTIARGNADAWRVRAHQSGWCDGL